MYICFNQRCSLPGTVLLKEKFIVFFSQVFEYSPHRKRNVTFTQLLGNYEILGLNEWTELGLILLNLGIHYMHQSMKMSTQGHECPSLSRPAVHIVKVEFEYTSYSTYRSQIKRTQPKTKFY